MTDVTILITSGDPASISPEIIVKTLKKHDFQKKSKIVVIGTKEVFTRFYRFNNFKDITNLNDAKENQISLINIPLPINKIKIGKPSIESAKASYQYILKAVELIKNKNTHLVTLPVSKEAINKAGIKFTGHTELLKNLTGSQQTEMLIISKNLKVALVTRHIPLKNVTKEISVGKLISTITFIQNQFKRYFGCSKPNFMICGLNPHCGDGGVIGNEETKIILPAIYHLKSKGINVSGSYTFENAVKLANDKTVITSLYHDQAFPPLKLLYGMNLVNLTIGLPFIRTSPVHGVGFDIAGKNKADPSGLVESIKLTINLSKNWKG